MSAYRSPSAAALIIGSELLSGKTQDQNVLVLARSLRRLGVELRRVLVVPDDLALVSAELRSLSASFDWVFTSGGIGPTHDDITIAAVAAAFDTSVEIEPSLARMIEAHFGDALLPGHLLMARIPKGCDLIASDELKWPTVRMRNVWVLPGVPDIFRERIAHVEQHFAAHTPFVTRSVFTKLDEGQLVPMLDQVVLRFPSVSVGSYPKWKDPRWCTQLTFDGTDADAVDQALEAFLGLIPEGEPVRVA